MLRVVAPAAAAGVAEVDDAPRAAMDEQRLEMLRGVEAVGRRGKFVRHRGDAILGQRALEERIDKARPVRAEHPRHPHRQMLRRHREQLLLATLFALAIHAHRIRRRALIEGALGLAAEHVVRADVNHARAFFRG